MNQTEMRMMVRRDLKDEDAGNYRWTDDELDRHIEHAVKDFSEAVPDERKEIVSTVSGSREIDISTITNRVMVEAVEYPTGRFPKKYQRFSLWSNTITLLGDEVPDGSDVCIYYGRIHELDTSGSTIPVKYEELIAMGACGYAAVERAAYTINRVNVGGDDTTREFLVWGKKKLGIFKAELKRIGKTNRIRISSLYRPYYPVVSKSTDYGP